MYGSTQQQDQRTGLLQTAVLQAAVLLRATVLLQTAVLLAERFNSNVDGTDLGELDRV